jgi:predicted nuclease of predicted toxin-antitoxin system
VKILVDVCLSSRWIAILEEAGFEAVHWSSVGAVDAPDRIIMEYAIREGYVILTRDLDFGTILAATRDLRPSVVQLRVKRASPSLIGIYVADVLRQSAIELEGGAFLTLDLKRTRLRILPLNRHRD